MLTIKTISRHLASAKSIIMSFFFEFGFSYPTPDSLSYSWNFGFIALCCLVFQIITGVIMTFHYVADTAYAFESIEIFMRETQYGYFIRYGHSNGASFFFTVVYIHMGKAFFQASYVYPRQSVWFSGVIIFILMMAIAFMGYVLPWGQMSFWGATVITGIFTVIPMIGDLVLLFLLGDFSISNPTLTRFLGFHVILPFILAAIVAFHLIFLHNSGSNNKGGAGMKFDVKNFLSLFMLKDFGFLNWVIAFCGTFVFFSPNYLGHPDNYIKANPLITPAHIVPEWYFLPFYAILRSVPSKSYGALLMALSLLILFLLPYLNTMSPKASVFQPYNELLSVAFILNFIFLGWLGGQTIEPNYVFLARWFTGFYFFYFLVLLPWGSFVQEEMENVEFFNWMGFGWVNYPSFSAKDFVKNNFKIFGNWNTCVFSSSFRSKRYTAYLSENFKPIGSDKRFSCVLFQYLDFCRCSDNAKVIMRPDYWRWKGINLEKMRLYVGLRRLKTAIWIFRLFEVDTSNFASTFNYELSLQKRKSFSIKNVNVDTVKTARLFLKTNVQ